MSKKVIKFPTPKASLGIALIARNAEKTLGACLDSIVPYVEQVVVCVDKTSTDATAKVAKKHGAEVHSIAVSHWHECEYHGRILVQHFANARQESFSYLRKDLDFHGWVDADDTVRGGEKLPKAISSLRPDTAGLWLPYHYATAGEGGPTTTLFDRERFVRTSVGWRWRFRVHEVLAPIAGNLGNMGWERTDEISIWHQCEGHDTHGSARRNITLLEIDLEENEKDTRAWFYLGNQYFALADYATSIGHYQRALSDPNDYQRWQSLIYIAMAYEQLGDLNNAKLACYQAIDTIPIHPEPYYRLASISMMANELPRVEFWAGIGNSMRDAPNFAFKNPMDRTYNIHLTLATAYANNGEASKAKRELEQAAHTLPTKEVIGGIAFQQKLEDDAATANSMLRVMDAGVPVPRESITDDIWRFGRVRDAILPDIIKHRNGTQPRIAFWCGRSLEPWAPPSINSGGIGGSETAVIQIARRFALDGWMVDVYNECDKFEGVYDTVGYWDLKRWDGRHVDVFVGWRNHESYQVSSDHHVSLLWCHDLHRGPGAGEQFARWTKVLGVSEWHAAYLSQLYNAEVGYVPNGIELDRFQKDIPKVPFRCVYASSPDRGLPVLLALWPLLHSCEPSAELHIAYGWNNIDPYIARGDEGMARLKSVVEEMVAKTPGVVWRGRLAQDELAELYLSSYAMLYPTSFTETFCIGAVEAMAGGCVPVTSAAGALPSTIGPGGIIVTGNTYSNAWKDFYILCARAALQNPELRKHHVVAGKQRAAELTWDKAYEKWKETVMPLLEHKEVPCATLV